MDPMLHTAGSQPVHLEFGTLHSVLTGGNHHPWLCQLEDATGPAGFWVVKPQHVVSRSTQRAELGVLSELAAAEVCAWLSLRSPRIGLVRIPAEWNVVAVPNDLDESLRREVTTTLQINAGKLAFCGRHLDGADDLTKAPFAQDEHRELLLDDGAKLFFLDAYLRHDDRQVENPNALWWRDGIVAIDHGNAFAGLGEAGQTGAGVAGRTVLSNSPQRHVLRDLLAQVVDDINLSDAVQRIEGINDLTIEAAAKGWPDELNVRSRRQDEALRTRLVRFLKHRRAVAQQIAENALKELRRKS